MTAPTEVQKLVERFEYNLADYKRGKYNETQVRREFIDPFFKALGWDIDNDRGYAEAYKEVVHEDAIKIGRATKAPDYSFRVGGLRKFFLEAKKPSVDIKHDTHPAYQLRRYAWSAKLPLSILTDFEEFAVYDCRVKPVKTDKAAAARIKYITFRDYLDQWDELVETFSPEAIRKGAFDKYAETTKTKRGTAEVDAAFLQEIERWREMLARNIALRNSLSQRELNFAVQLTIDRIIFLRIAEDRGIEPYQQLRDLLKQPNVYGNLLTLFRRADDRYNSGLFHFQAEKGRENPDNLTPGLKIDDKVFQDIFKNLYYPDSPYEFSVLPADILGQVYEQFLGKVIRLTSKGQAKVEDKPEVKKAGGVFYTPTYIVDYIVAQTVGKLVEGKAPNQIRGKSPLRILDPACGSGSFLIGAYQFLLDWYRSQYASDPSGPDKWLKGKNPRLYKTTSDEWGLTTEERKEILVNHIFGVDIDPQAVEVTKLSLLLKVLEGEDQQSLARQLSLIGMGERVLPDLESNIKCGNSLIGPDFYASNPTQMSMFDEDEFYRINAFDWQAEFTEIMGAGGFDAVIGNPPYLRIQGLQEYYGDQISYFIKNYQSAIKRFDLYLLFIEKGFHLLAQDGYLGFICPHKFLNSDFGSGLREFLIKSSALETFISFGNNLIFSQASTYTGILVLRKNDSMLFSYYEFLNMPISELSTYLPILENFAVYNLKEFSNSPWILTSSKIQTVLNKLSHQPQTLGEVFDEILVGVQSGIDNVHVLKKVSEPFNGTIKLFSERAGTSVEIETELVKPFLRGEDVHRYAESQHSYYCIYPYRLVNGKTKIIAEPQLKAEFPLGYAYLNRYKAELKEIRIRQRTNPQYWYSCHRSRDMNVFESNRIVTPEISLGCNMTLASKGIYHNTKVYSLLPSKSRPEGIKYWLGVLNSNVLWWFLSNTGYVLRGGYYVFKTNYLKPFPIRTIDFNNSTDKARHDQIVSLVERILDLNKQLAQATMPQAKTMLKRQIEATDKQIDRLVYELYGLTDEEIKIVEGEG